ncbi:MAG: DUF4364 family protein [Clostridia bacterium]|nr:DUF4364 family protein [Clostridia bacterium]
MATDSTLVKLIILYAMDKMEVALEEDVLTDLCTGDNNWMNYMDCKDALAALEDVSFILKKNLQNKVIYSITHEGRMCLANFYTRIPFSLRDEIYNAVKKDRMKYRHRQEYLSDYYRNSDQTYTVHLRIMKPGGEGTLVELKMVVDSQETATYIYKNWQDRAGSVYGALCDILLDC